jgi:hypothetical protein
VLRIHFTERDLARVQVATAPDPLWETVLAVQHLGTASKHRPVYRKWRHGVRPHMAGLAGPLRMAKTLIPPVSYFPDFLTPFESAGGLADGLDALRGTSPTRLRDETALVAASGPVPGWVRDLATGDRVRLDEVGEGMRLLHDGLVRPHLRTVESHVDRERAVRARAVADGGVEGMLDSLRPVMQWKPPVLAARYPVDRDIYLNGKGLRLIPSYFCWDTPVALVDPGLPQVVVYPVSHDPQWTCGGHALGALLGPTRAAVLRGIASAPTSAELVARLGISATAVSRHTTVLRDAGLITSRRLATAVLHTLTPLGSALLDESR